MRKLIALCLLFVPVLSWAAIDTYEFKDEATRERFKQLTFELRCPKCQNQNLQDSNSPIAADLRNEVYKMLTDGSDNDEIVDFMVARYGDFVLYKPPVNKMTYVLWYGPFVLVAVGIVVMLVISRKRKKVSKEGVDLEKQLSEDESQRLKNILDGDRND
ncbi:cytochrome c-type biogenesis protein [Neptuniibacter caesariensis]|uniref:Cytochrome c-type biogenesis protein n=1 Tax=Neptuniibacter caesariensis TaxID=207954 RepID=A0A7U8C2Y9_NEPCE|nr:cytochrome c-type biogenesis protein [Neptuniibacter caesariensis]EAR60543.1 cytochrome c-type biogenesis protein CycL [Oceanospirillum sp. MED92] [Neptuniibacter caesariensis]